MVRHRARWAVVALLLGAATAKEAEATPRRKIVDSVVAVVDEACITQSELSRFLAPHEVRRKRELASKPAERATASAQLRMEGVQALIDRRLFATYAARMGLEVSESEIDTALGSVAAQNHLTVPEVLAAAKEQGLDAARYRADLLVQILEGKIIWHDAPRRYQDWSALSADERLARASRGRDALLAELREQAVVEIRR